MLNLTEILTVEYDKNNFGVGHVLGNDLHMATYWFLQILSENVRCHSFIYGHDYSFPYRSDLIKTMVDKDVLTHLRGMSRFLKGLERC